MQYFPQLWQSLQNTYHEWWAQLGSSSLFAVCLKDALLKERVPQGLFGYRWGFQHSKVVLCWNFSCRVQHALSSSRETIPELFRITRYLLLFCLTKCVLEEMERNVNQVCTDGQTGLYLTHLNQNQFSGKTRWVAMNTHQENTSSVITKTWRLTVGSWHSWMKEFLEGCLGSHGVFSIRKWFYVETSVVEFNML